MTQDDAPRSQFFSVADAKAMFQRLFFLTDQRVQRQIGQVPKMLGEFALEASLSDDANGIHVGAIMGFVVPWRCDAQRLIIWVDNPSSSVTVSIFFYQHMDGVAVPLSALQYTTVNGELDLADVSATGDEANDGSQRSIDPAGLALTGSGFLCALEAGSKVFVRVEAVVAGLAPTDPPPDGTTGPTPLSLLPHFLGTALVCRLRSNQALTVANAVGSSGPGFTP